MKEEQTSSPRPRQSQKATPELLETILKLYRKRGLKQTTMDFVARSLGMSKRTLYEIFGSKEDMVMAVFDYDVECRIREDERIFREAPNPLVAVLRVFLHHRDIISSLTNNFFSDMAEYHPKLHRRYRRDQRQVHEEMTRFYKLGVEAGLFRPGVNFPLSCVLVKVQMEGIKRIEQFFPEELSILEAFDGICLSFMRSIVSDKGARLLDDYCRDLCPHLTSHEEDTADLQQDNKQQYNDDKSDNQESDPMRDSDRGTGSVGTAIPGAGVRNADA